jgi:hypothetical protein
MFIGAVSALGSICRGRSESHLKTSLHDMFNRL